MTDAVIRTVLGDIPAAPVGHANYHEHLFHSSPLLPGDELDDPEKSGLEAQAVRDAGTALVVEATPTGLGAQPAAVARISRRTGLHIVHVTGAHHGGHYADDHPLRDFSESQLAARFRSDVETGFEGQSGPDAAPVRAGMIKAAARYWAIGPFERRVLGAAAAAHRDTGTPIMVHLDHGSAAHEVLDLLADDGVASDRIVLAHIDRNLDAGLHLSLTERGAYLGYDGWARHREAPDAAIIACLVEVVARGGAHRVVLGGDVARASRYLSYGGMPGLAYVERRVLPRLRAVLGDAQTAQISTDTIVGLLGFRPGRAEG